MSGVPCRCAPARLGRRARRGQETQGASDAGTGARAGVPRAGSRSGCVPRPRPAASVSRCRTRRGRRGRRDGPSVVAFPPAGAHRRAPGFGNEQIAGLISPCGGTAGGRRPDRRYGSRRPLREASSRRLARSDGRRAAGRRPAPPPRRGSYAPTVASCPYSQSNCDTASCGAPRPTALITPCATLRASPARRWNSRPFARLRSSTRMTRGQRSSS